MDNLISQLMGGASLANLNMTFMAAVFVALIFRPERIASVPQLRMACILFAISLCVPSVSAFFNSAPVTMPGMVAQRQANSMLPSFSTIAQLILFVAAFLMGAFAMMPRSNSTGSNGA